MRVVQPELVSPIDAPLPHKVEETLAVVVSPSLPTSEEQLNKLVNFFFQHFAPDNPNKTLDLGCRLASSFKRHVAGIFPEKFNQKKFIQEVCANILLELTECDQIDDLPCLMETLGFVSTLLTEKFESSETLESLELRHNAIQKSLIAVSIIIQQHSNDLIPTNLLEDYLKSDGEMLKQKLFNDTCLQTAIRIAAQLMENIDQSLLDGLESVQVAAEEQKPLFFAIELLAKKVNELFVEMLKEQFPGPFRYREDLFKLQEKLKSVSVLELIYEFIQKHENFYLWSQDFLSDEMRDRGKVVCPRLGRAFVCLAKDIRDAELVLEDLDQHKIAFISSMKEQIKIAVSENWDYIPESIYAVSHFSSELAATAILKWFDKLSAENSDIRIKTNRIYRSLAQAISMPNVIDNIFVKLTESQSSKKEKTRVTAFISQIAGYWHQHVSELDSENEPLISLALASQFSDPQILKVKLLPSSRHESLSAERRIRRDLFKNTANAILKINLRLESILLSTGSDADRNIKGFVRRIIPDYSNNLIRKNLQLRTSSDYLLKITGLACIMISGKNLTTGKDLKNVERFSPLTFAAQLKFACHVLEIALSQTDNRTSHLTLASHCQTMLESSISRLQTLRKNEHPEMAKVAKDSLIELHGIILRNAGRIGLYGVRNYKEKFTEVEDSIYIFLRNTSFQVLSQVLREKPSRIKDERAAHNIDPSYKIVSAAFEIQEALVRYHPLGYAFSGSQLFDLAVALSNKCGEVYLDVSKELKSTLEFERQRQIAQRAMLALALYQKTKLKHIKKTVSKNKDRKKSIHEVKKGLEATWKTLTSRDSETVFPEAILGMAYLLPNDTAQLLCQKKLFDPKLGQIVVKRCESILKYLMQIENFLDGLAYEICRYDYEDQDEYFNYFAKSVSQLSSTKEFISEYLGGLSKLWEGILWHRK
ncbi:MAG: hypothetical protein R3A13_11835 [Bdellovibrionota bacterium]